MKNLSTSKYYGFTLIEVMIVVVIVGILAAIVFPSYMEYVRTSNRTEAKVEMNDIAHRLQRCFTAYSAYNDGNCAAANDISGGSTISSENNHYSISGVLTATTYTLTASPQSGSTQIKDSDCTSFTLTHAGVRGATGSDTADCW
ncbi:type IV pilin protein [Microbulbifer sp. SSSA008]|uniref:type IV pilin protein n=1 Tax=Microbulbifer sp. SSSA008 TaxID=3243380 RepID=UPI00403A1633